MDKRGKNVGTLRAYKGKRLTESYEASLLKMGLSNEMKPLFTNSSEAKKNQLKSSHSSGGGGNGLVSEE